MGHGARGLLRARHGLGLLPARPRPEPDLSLGRGRSPRDLRSRVPALLRRRTLERSRPDPEGASLRPRRPRGQPRRGREGALLLPRLDPDAFVHEGALQVPAGGAFPTPTSSPRTAGAGSTIPSTSSPTRGVFDEQRYFDVTVEYAKAGPNDILVRITVANRGPDAARLDLLPTLWFRNTWSWGRIGEGYWRKGKLHQVADGGRRGRAPVARAHALLGGASRGRCARAALHRERDQQRAALRRPERDAVREGRASTRSSSTVGATP